MLSMEQMYQAALRMPEPRLLGILRGQDNSLPQAVAEAALRMKKRAMQAGMAQQGMSQQPEPTQKDKLLAEYGGVAGLPAEFDMSGAQQQQGIASFAGGGQVEADRRSEDLPDILDALRYGYGKLRGAGDEFLRRRVEQHAQDVEDANMPGPPVRYAGVRDTKASAATKGDDAPLVSGPLTPEERALVSSAGRVSESASARGGIGGLSVAMPRRPTLQAMPEPEAMPTAPRIRGASDVASARDEIMKGMNIPDPKTVDEYIAERRATEDKYGVNRDPYKKLQERLEKEDARDGERRRTAANEALISAGLGMLSGRSQYAGVNIGRGAQAGLNQYRSDRDALDKSSMERARALADIEKAKSDIARGDVTQGYALYNSAVARLDKAKADATQAGSMLTGQQMTAENSQFNTQSQAVGERNALAQRGVAEANRNLVSMYGVDAQTAAQLQAAGISAATHRAIAAERNSGDKRDRVIAEARQMVEKSSEYNLALRNNPEAYNTAVARAFARIWPLYSNPNMAAASENAVGIGTPLPPGKTLNDLVKPR